jgi:hypothetical protein
MSIQHEGVPPMKNRRIRGVVPGHTPERIHDAAFRRFPEEQHDITGLISCRTPERRL